jgi:hypothetical protein
MLGKRIRMCGAVLGCALAAALALASEDKVSLGEVASRAVKQSKLTLPNSRPFHLKAEIVETTNPSSEYQAKVEEYWVSPEKWRRTIEAPGFSQTLIVNGDKVFEKNDGDYFPWWLNDLVTAMVDPLPMVEMLKQVNAQIAKPKGSETSNTCADLHTKIDRWVFCFEGSHGLLTPAFTRGYSAEFKDFKSFGDKRVARVLIIDPVPGTTIQARVTELTELSQPDEDVFTIAQPTPLQERIGSSMVDEDMVRKMSTTSTDVVWPAVGGGLTKGRCAVFVSADSTGHMREVWPAGCDNTGLQDPLREIVKKWQLTPMSANGVPVQVEALVTFEYETHVEASNPLPELSDAEARKLVTKMVAPVFPPGNVEKGTDVVVRISVDETGKLTGVGNPDNAKEPAVLAAYNAIRQWSFQPYLKDGKPQYFHASIAFHIQ